ncbi:MAG: hypothetical protein RBS09_01790 [Anaerolineaceae bacterium]|jgi:hypothetical protein|nr:hypothetical protein [Anaerolineaceae bacterium]
MKPRYKLLGLLIIIVVLVTSIVSVAQAANLYGTRRKCPGPNGAACTGCVPNPNYPNLYHCTYDGKVRNYNNTCTWWSSMDLVCQYPEVCHCITANYADHCASSCAYK